MKGDNLSIEIDKLNKQKESMMKSGGVIVDPRATLLKYATQASQGEVRTQTPNDYIDIVTALKVIHTKYTSRLRLDKDGSIVVDKMNIRIKGDPFAIVISKV